MRDKTITGYLECDGIIKKISSLEDVNNFVIKYGSFIKELSENELDELTTKDGVCVRDDSGVQYLYNPLILKEGVALIFSYKIKDGTVAISNNAFHKFRSNFILRAIYMPNSILVIGGSAFCDNKCLYNVVLPQSLIKIGRNAFSGCTSLTSLFLPENLKIIDVSA